MKRNWKNIKWIFEPDDGSLRDIYVQDVSLDDWKKVIKLMNEKYRVDYNNTEQIDIEYTIKYLEDETGEIESRSASIYLGNIRLNCHFFLEDQIEFDINPKEINSIQDFEMIEEFMIDISREIDNQITLTAENNPRFPIVKIDTNREINRILSEEEVKKHWKNQNSFASKMKAFRTKMEMKFAPNRFKEKLLKSASEPYRSTRKSENVW